VAIHSAGGIRRLVPAVEETRSTPGFKSSEISSVGLFLDADWETPAPDTFARLKAEIQAVGLPSADEPGTVNHATPRTGLFIFPDTIAPERSKTSWTTAPPSSIANFARKRRNLPRVLRRSATRMMIEKNSINPRAR
jgi:hypothetical protein